MAAGCLNPVQGCLMLVRDLMARRLAALPCEKGTKAPLFRGASLLGRVRVPRSQFVAREDGMSDQDNERAIYAHRSTGDPNEHADHARMPWEQAVEVKRQCAICRGSWSATCTDNPLTHPCPAPIGGVWDHERNLNLRELAAHEAGPSGEQAKQELSAEARTVAQLRAELDTERQLRCKAEAALKIQAIELDAATNGRLNILAQIDELKARFTGWQGKLESAQGKLRFGIQFRDLDPIAAALREIDDLLEALPKPEGDTYV